MHSLWEPSTAKMMIFMKHGPFRTLVNRYQIIEYALFSYLFVGFVLSCKATDTGWMRMPCANVGATGRETDREDNQVGKNLTQGQAGAANAQGTPVD